MRAPIQPADLPLAPEVFILLPELESSFKLNLFYDSLRPHGIGPTSSEHPVGL